MSILRLPTLPYYNLSCSGIDRKYMVGPVQGKLGGVMGRVKKHISKDREKQFRGRVD